jgi:hypothetical protein
MASLLSNKIPTNAKAAPLAAFAKTPLRVIINFLLGTDSDRNLGLANTERKECAACD